MDLKTKLIRLLEELKGEKLSRESTLSELIQELNALVKRGGENHVSE